MSTKSEQLKEAMCFRFRWFDTLQCLPEPELRQMLAAIREYAENDQAPEFGGIAAALWNEFKTCIDHDKAEYATVCERNRANGSKGGRPKKQEVFEETEQNPENPAGFCENQSVFEKPSETQLNPTEPKKADVDLDLKKETSSKEDAKKKSFSLNQTSEKVVVLKPLDFSRWEESDFIASVYAAIGRNQAFAPFREEFCRYWLEPDKKGRPRFKLQKTWQTAGRLATWAKKAGKMPAPAAAPEKSLDERIRELQEA
ncbi:MAG: hypothetical protein IJV93_13415 [Lentisphaeria bacterium]|nr:hypothetical protein [Lentisphaeria bacterium]